MPAQLLRHPLARLIRLDKPVGALLLLWPTLTALWLAAGGWPGAHLFAVMLLGTFCMRSAGCALNDYADRDIDGRVERTRDRPLATGELQPHTALIVALLLTAAAAALVASTHPLAVAVAAAGVPIAAVYPFVKRVSNYPQFVLGVAFSWGVPVAWTAVAQQMPPAAVALFAGTWFWVFVYDTEYAMRDRADDLKLGVGSTAIGFGPHERLAILVAQLAALGLWWCAGALAGAGVAWYAALGLVALLFARQIWMIRDRDPQACFRAFNLNALTGAVLFAGAVVDAAI